MDNTIPALIFGACLLVVGGAFLAAEIVAGRRRRGESMDKPERTYFTRRHRRRMQVAGLILLIGVMIPVGDSLIPWRKAPGTFAVYWMIVLALTLWTILLALGDRASTKLFEHVTLSRLERQRIELEQAAERLRRSRANGESGEN